MSLKYSLRSLLLSVVLVILTSNTTAASSLVLRDCDPDIVVAGLEVQGERFGIIAINCPGIQIRDNTIWFHGGEGSGGGGIVLFESPGATVERNRVYSYGGFRSGVGIRVHRSSDATVDSNWIDLRGESNNVDGECIAVNSARAVVSRNHVRGCPGIGILLWGGVANNNDGCVVDSNTIIDPGFGLKQGKNWAYPGVVVISRDSRVRNATITNNLRLWTGNPKSRNSWQLHRVADCDNCYTFGNGGTPRQ